MGLSSTNSAARFPYGTVKGGLEIGAADVQAVEVIVRWGSTILRVAHLTPRQSFYVGDDSSGSIHCDYFLPQEAIGRARAPLVVPGLGAACLVILSRAHGIVDIPGEGEVTLTSLVASGRLRESREVAGAFEYALAPGTIARFGLEGSALTFEISTGTAEKPPVMSWLSPPDPAALLYATLSFFLHAGLMTTLAFFMPPMRSDDSEAIDADRILTMEKLLNAAAEREQTERETRDPSNARSVAPTTGSGAAARNPAGSMGTVHSKEIGKRYAVAGPSQNPDAHLARTLEMRQAATFGSIGMLLPMSDPASDAPTSPWGRNDSSGRDALNAVGNLFGDKIGEAFGAGGLDLSGASNGGGGTREDSIGLGDFGGGLAHGAGPGNQQGIRFGFGRPNGGHVVRRITAVEGTTTVVGRLPAEIIQRIVHQNFGRFRFCYETAIGANPRLEGRVTVKFTISRTGAVATVVDGGSDMPDRSVVECVVRAFNNLSFPPPEGGMVTVVYPIAFTPGD